jgi:hypothetical protein
VVLPGTDHRKVAFSAAEFRAQFTFLTGAAPAHDSIVPMGEVVLGGMVSDTRSGALTNLPVAGSEVTVHRVDPVAGARLGPPVHRQRTNERGRWGPSRAAPDAHYAFEVAAPDSAVLLHVYWSPFPRSSRVVHFRLPAAPRA